MYLQMPDLQPFCFQFNANCPGVGTPPVTLSFAIFALSPKSETQLFCNQRVAHSSQKHPGGGVFFPIWFTPSFEGNSPAVGGPIFLPGQTALIPRVQLNVPSAGERSEEEKRTGDMEMKHFTTEDWVDFVNHAASSNQRQAMQKHLESGCKRCTETVTLWQKVRNTAAEEAKYQPPAANVRIAKAAFATAGRIAQPKQAGGFIRLVFDSFLQPAVAGARSAGAGMRQMLYRADPYQVDIQIESKPDGNRMVITGQLLDISRPDIVGREIEVSFSNKCGSVVHAVTNKFGEFRGEIENSGDLELSFPRPDEKPIVISLRNALDRLPGTRSC
jgi:hypothetical protein